MAPTAMTFRTLNDLESKGV